MIVYLNGRAFRNFVAAFALFCSVFACGFARPASAQIRIDVPFAPVDEVPICIENFEIVVSQDDECGASAGQGQDPEPSTRGISFGPNGANGTTYLSANGDAYFEHYLQIEGDTLITGTIEIDNGLTLFGGLDSQDGITNRRGLSNSGGITNTGGITSSGTFTNNGAFTNNGNLTVRDRLATDTFTANSAQIAGYATVGGVLTASGGADIRGRTDAEQVIISNSLRMLSGTSIDMGGNRIQNVGAPIAGTDAANKAYVDAVAGNSSNTGQSTASALGGGATYDPATGTVSAPSYAIGATTYNDVGSALNAVADRGDQSGRSVASALGGGSAYDPATGSVSAPSYAVGTASYDSVGSALNAANTSGLAYFHSNSTLPDGAAAGANSIAVGSSHASGANAVAIGSGSTAGGAGSFAAGNGAVASANGAVAVGQGAQATGVNAIAIGNGAKATGSVAVGVGASAANGGAAYGDRAVATGANSAALGPDANAVADNSVAIGSGSTATTANTVSFGTATNQRRLTNVAAGVASTDAATVGQLQTSSASVAAAFGGGSVVRADGSISAPSYSIGGVAYNNVGSALNGVVALSYDIRTEARRGIAVSAAMGTAPMPSEPGRTSWIANTAIFRGEVGFGGSIAHRFDTKVPLALTAGFGYARGGNTIGKVGMAGEF